jgi:nitrogenase-associated protein
MTNLIFYEKPGCGGNARQKALLISSGHEVEVRNLLSATWTPATLRPFFGTKPLLEWFNPSSPRIKSGSIDPGKLSEATALVMMIEDPLLIRRPLMQVGDRREAGFDQAVVDAWIGLRTPAIEVTDRCLHEGDAAHVASCKAPTESQPSTTSD